MSDISIIRRPRSRYLQLIARSKKSLLCGAAARYGKETYPTEIEIGTCYPEARRRAKICRQDVISLSLCFNCHQSTERERNQTSWV